MLHHEHPDIKKLLLTGKSGLEKESLRIYNDGHFSHTAHPFPDDPCLVRDFCENQLEINTKAAATPEGALRDLIYHHRKAEQALHVLPVPEYLWPFSNPPYIRNEDDIPVAQFSGDQRSKTVYRNYLAEKYGKYKMTFCGIHFNYSLSDELLNADFSLSEETNFYKYRDRLYLNAARNLMRNGWIITVLCAASPLLDGSFLNRDDAGKTVFSGMASTRCSELGYWNHFVPVINYHSVFTYADGIREMVQDGMIASQTEYYYPVRLKSRGENSLDELEKTGIDHIELRNIDLNPYAEAGICIEDLKFMQLLVVYDSCIHSGELSKEEQITAELNFKNASHYDIDIAKILSNGVSRSVRQASARLLDQMDTFFTDKDAREIIDFQRQKLTGKSARYAVRVHADFAEGFVKRGLEYTIKKAPAFGS